MRLLLEKMVTSQWFARSVSTSASDVKDWMHDYYVSLDPVEFAANSGRERLARILLMREFARRPKRVNTKANSKLEK